MTDFLHEFFMVGLWLYCDRFFLPVLMVGLVLRVMVSVFPANVVRKTVGKGVKG